VKGLLWIPVLLGLALCWAAVDQGSGIRKSWQLRTDLRAAHERIETLRGEVERLRDAAARLESDSFAIESAIREDLGLARAGEIVVRRPRDPGPTPRTD
jgi:cell division protein FtsB